MKAPGEPVINRYKTQSISVNEDELEVIKEVARRLRMKPAALARDLFYRGLAAFLDDGVIHADETDDVIFERLKESLKSDTFRSASVYKPEPHPSQPSEKEL
jgi:hypothetical protein